MCYEDVPKYGNDIDEVDFMVRRVNDSVLRAFESVDGGGNYISKDIKTSMDQYTKSVHNLMGLVTGGIAHGQESRCGALPMEVCLPCRGPIPRRYCADERPRRPRGTMPSSGVQRI